MPDNNKECHVFISYAHIDNQTLTREQEGWVTFFHRALEIRVAQLLGGCPRIWRDPKLHGNDKFDDEIKNRVKKAELFVAVLSPGYVESGWCCKEIREFMETRERNKGACVDNRSRIFKVVKTRLPLERQPREIQDQLGYEFFMIDPVSNRLKEFNRGFGVHIEPEYMDRLEDLAHDIEAILESIGRAGSPPGREPASPQGICVFLAETTYDLRARRDQVRRELVSRGHTVLPDRPLPSLGWELADVVREKLEQCAFSIHLVGEHYGIVPEAADRSAVELQLSLAGEFGVTNRDFSRLIWMPENLEVKDPRQEAFVERLMKEATLRQGDELMSADFEELKAVVQERLENMTSKREENTEAGDDLNRVYLIYDQRDMESIEPLEDYFYDLEYEVLHPLFDGDESDIVEEHWENLRICDGVLIYQGNSGEAWLRGKLRDLRKAMGYGRKKPVKSSAVYMASPRDRRRERFKTREVHEVIKNFEDFSPGRLSGFLARLKEGEGGKEG